MRVTPWLAGLFFLALPVLAAPRHRDPAEWRSSRIVRDTVEVRDSLAAADSVLSGELPRPDSLFTPQADTISAGIQAEYCLLPEVVEALRGNDVITIDYRSGIMTSRAAGSLFFLLCVRLCSLRSGLS